MFKNVFSNKEKNKKRVSPSARTPEGLVQSHPMYQYAMNEYAQTVPAATQNEDGRSVIGVGEGEEDIIMQVSSSQELPTQPSASLRSRSASATADSSSSTSTQQQKSKPQYIGDDGLSPISPLGPSTSYFPPQQEKLKPHRDYLRRNRKEPIMPDVTYEELYGDAYVGGPIRYIYPSGYQSMRPRGGPWKLSIIVCSLFTWLSIFVIGHCSDRVDQSLYDQAEIDDDKLVIETRWCGSQLLYGMWVISMSITGISAAYCSVIGYIKLRDFVVANTRSQPPGTLGKSDYYVQITESYDAEEAGGSGAPPRPQHKPIYQADGTPQFWGGHIYRPTQLAVAVTSR